MRERYTHREMLYAGAAVNASLFFLPALSLSLLILQFSFLIRLLLWLQMWTGRGVVIEKGVGCLYLGKVMNKGFKNRARRYKCTTKSNGFIICQALRKMGSGNESRLDNKRWKKCWVQEVSQAVCGCGKRDSNSDTLQS